MAATATSTKKSAVLTPEVLASAAAAHKTVAKTQDSPFANIQTNTFAKIISDPNLKLEEKRAAVEQALTFTGSKEEMRTRVSEFEAMKEYLQSTRSEMAQSIIKLTDSEAFGELKNIYEQMNGALIDFDEKMAPLTDIIDAVYTLRTNGEAPNAFKEIIADRKRRLEIEASRLGLTTQVQDITRNITDLNDEIETQSHKKTLFGFGKITPAAAKAIAVAQSKIADRTTDLEGVRVNIAALNDEEAELNIKTGEFAAQKAKLRELLDISGPEHKARQEALIQAAMNFVDTAHERLGAVRSHLGLTNDQIERLKDDNGDLTQVYAIFNEGIKGAEKKNYDIRGGLAEPAEGSEDLITKMKREESLSNIDSHIKMLDASASDTMMAYGDLTTQTIRINAMKESNDDQISQARTMHSQGVAGVADRLSVVLQAVSAAAISESSSMARDTLATMAENTNRIAQKEVIRVASGAAENTKEIEKAIDVLSGYGDVRRAATDIYSKGIRESREALERMQSTVKSVEESIRDAGSANSEIEPSNSQGGAKVAAPAAGGFRLNLKSAG